MCNAQDKNTQSKNDLRDKIKDRGKGTDFGRWKGDVGTRTEAPGEARESKKIQDVICISTSSPGCVFNTFHKHIVMKKGGDRGPGKPLVVIQYESEAMKHRGAGHITPCLRPKA